MEVKKIYKVRVTNLPKYMAYPDVNKFLKNSLGELSFSKLNYNGKVAYFTCLSEKDAIESVKLLDNAKIKNKIIKAKMVMDDNVKKKKPNKSSKSEISKTARTASELVTPLANLPYEEQLEIKFNTSKEIMLYIIKLLMDTKIVDVVRDNICLEKVLPAPSIKAYRNKCEFSFGYSKTKKQIKDEIAVKKLIREAQKYEEDFIPHSPSSPISIIIGFINGKMIEGRYDVLPIEECQNLSLNTISVVKHFQTLVNEFNERPFNEFIRKGFWKMLTVKDFLGDCMLIVTVYPHKNPLITSRIKNMIVEKFFPQNPLNLLPDCNVTSIFWQEQINSSDEKNYELLAGPPFVYESLLGCNFRISPSTFFQTNTTGAALLYSTIGDLLKLPKLVNVPGSGKLNRLEKIQNKKLVKDETDKNMEITDNNDSEEFIEKKKPRLDEENNKELTTNSQKYGSNVFLDICCGAGSIGICLMNRVRQSINEGTISDFSKVPYGCVGVDLNVKSIRDARQNALENGFGDKNCLFICGQAECVFKDLMYYMPKGCFLQNANVMGILDPPRGGTSDKVIIWCRKLYQLQTLIYVSCDPRAAAKNFVDLCRPMSCKYDGKPFRIVSIQPVDLFPMTDHIEWILKFERV